MMKPVPPRPAPAPSGELPIIAWVTKYALTKGVFSVTRAEIDGSMLTVRCDGSRGPSRVYFHKPHWHETHEGALQQVARMREAVRRSLLKKLARLDLAGTAPVTPWDHGSAAAE